MAVGHLKASHAWATLPFYSMYVGYVRYCTGNSFRLKVSVSRILPHLYRFYFLPPRLSKE